MSSVQSLAGADSVRIRGDRGRCAAGTRSGSDAATSTLRGFWRRWFTRSVLPGQQDGYPDISFVELETSYWRCAPPREPLARALQRSEAPISTGRCAGSPRSSASTRRRRSGPQLVRRFVRSDEARRPDPARAARRVSSTAARTASSSRARMGAGRTSSRRTTTRSPTSWWSVFRPGCGAGSSGRLVAGDPLLAGLSPR
mgnify:CR=1 FL=1